MSSTPDTPSRDDEDRDPPPDEAGERAEVGIDPMSEPQLGPGKRRVVAPNEDAMDDEADDGA